MLHFVGQLFISICCSPSSVKIRCIFGCKLQSACRWKKVARNYKNFREGIFKGTENYTKTNTFYKYNVTPCIVKCCRRYTHPVNTILCAAGVEVRKWFKFKKKVLGTNISTGPRTWHRWESRKFCVSNVPFNDWYKIRQGKVK